MVAQTDLLYNALGDEFGEGAQRLGQRDRSVLLMGVEHVQTLHAQATAAALGGHGHGLGRQALLDPRPRCRDEGLDTELGGDHDLVGDPALTAPAAQEGLALVALEALHPELVAVGGVHEGAAGLDETVEEGRGGGVVRLAAELHRAQAQGADPAFADGGVAHQEVSSKGRGERSTSTPG